MSTLYIANEAHYKEVIARMGEVKRELWEETADIKDVYIEQFDGVWMGRPCTRCGRKKFCADGIA